jgi:hypothetical protein
VRRRGKRRSRERSAKRDDVGGIVGIFVLERWALASERASKEKKMKNN